MLGKMSPKNVIYGMDIHSNANDANIHNVWMPKQDGLELGRCHMVSIGLD
jgi:hypothetical protein